MSGGGKQKNKVKGKVVFIHPDLGIGGAERLIVDAAVGLQTRGYQVAVFTGYHNPSHAFPETTNGTLQVVPIGSFLPRSIFGKFVAVCAYLKMIYAALYLNLFSGMHPEVVVCDQVSACIPFLRFTWNPFARLPRVLYYCHFPDQLLTERKSFIKTVYRKPLDLFEGFTTGLADKIIVNSEFTRGIFHDTFPRIQTTPDILYPSINSNIFDEFVQKDDNSTDVPTNPFLFLSINRFEPKKNIALAIKSLRKLRTCLDSQEWEDVQLVLAGGYDERLESNVEYLAALKNLVVQENLENRVTFILSPNDSLKVALLSRCIALLYTPSNEHFGIVPLEAMYLKKPVIAVDSGGPRETVVNGVTGFLCPSNDTHFAVSMARMIRETELGKKYGKAGHQRFMDHFSFSAFSGNWVRAIESLKQ